MTTRGSNRRHRCKGQAMIEFVLVVPLLALVLGLTFFFGWAMKNQQRVAVSDRYAVWRGVTAGDWVGGGAINRRILENKADAVAVDYHGGPPTTVTRFVNTFVNVGPEAEALAGEIFSARCPGSHWADVQAHFPSDVGLYSRFAGAITGNHVREGREWRRGEMAFEWNEGGGQISLLSIEYFGDLDATLAGIPAPGNTVGDTFRNLYLVRW